MKRWCSQVCCCRDRLDAQKPQTRWANISILQRHGTPLLAAESLQHSAATGLDDRDDI